MLYRLLIRPLLAFCESLAHRRIERLELELRESRDELREARSTIRVLELEQEKLLDVIERDRQRVQAERKRFVAAGIKAADTADEHASRQ